MNTASIIADWIHNGHHAATARQSATNYNSRIARGEPSARVAIHPAHDAWMRGERYGSVLKLGHKFATVELEPTGRVRRISRDNLMTI